MFRQRGNGRLHSWCTPCKSEYDRTQDHRYVTRRLESNQKRRLQAQEFIFGVLAGKSCHDCGESNPIVLQFDHLDDKVDDVCKMASNGASVKTLQAEIGKCEIVCANCHTVRTHSRAQTARWRWFN